MAVSGKRIDSLTTLCIDCIVKNLAKYEDEIDSVKCLPAHIKDRMLSKLTSTSFYLRNVNVKKALWAMIHPLTKHIDLSLIAIDDELLHILKECYNLRDVYVARNRNESDEGLTSQGLVNFISSLKRLRLLRISNCDAVNDAVLISLAKNCPAVAGLDVHGCTNVTDIALEQMSHLQNLTSLTLSSTQVTNNGIEKLTKGASGLKIKELGLANCRNVTSDVLQIITLYCPNIEILVFYNMQPSVNDHFTYFPVHEGCLKNLKQLTWTVQW